MANKLYSIVKNGEKLKELKALAGAKKLADQEGAKVLYEGKCVYEGKPEEDAFCTVMNKLTFGRKEVLEELMDAIRSQSHKEGLQRVNEIDRALEGMAERLQNVTSIMTKGYIDPATYTRETNSLQMEAAGLEEERERLTREMGGDMRKTQGLKEILKYTARGEMLSEFDPGLFVQFVDHVTVCSQEEAIFHLKCGLNLPERME